MMDYEREKKLGDKLENVEQMLQSLVNRFRVVNEARLEEHLRDHPSLAVWWKKIEDKNRKMARRDEALAKLNDKDREILGL